ncbi:unnamed protein product [Didymodactylos carnosus]|uniref:Transposase n=2 Tax=Didymodactylos carnosus TaxID=1234261 RepID=A0A8S2QSR3_9BILA|nr:unnamed protein product [Didymodactylos carnosus]CAF4123112.1 unnamed protein product [Didymodactylos carnosus]
MREFLDIAVPGYKGVHRKTVHKRLSTLYSEYRHELREVLSKVSDIALTSDVWKNNARTHFICLTAHYYDENYKYVSRIIGFRRLRGQHLAIRLRRFIRYEIEKLQITSKIRSITTDKGSDINCAANTLEFGTKTSCLAHNLNLVISNGLWLWKKPTETR